MSETRIPLKVAEYETTWMVFRCPHCGADCWTPMGDTVFYDAACRPEPAQYPKICWKCKEQWSILDEEGQVGPHADYFFEYPNKTYKMIEKKHAKAKKKRKKGKKKRP